MSNEYTRQGTLNVHVDALCEALHGVPENAFAALRDQVFKLLDSNQTLFLAGNGGSAATANHFAADLMKRSGFRLRCRSLSDSNAMVTAVANDIAYESVFSLPYRLLAGDGDLLIVISASGRSRNIVEVAREASEAKHTVIALTAFDGGALREIARPCIVVPTNDYGVAEDAHGAILHALANTLDSENP
jgi:D-sedoheptulose 7-phosphate isomerase